MTKPSVSAPRRASGLTRPELAVLLAYAKNVVNAELVATGVPDDPYLGRELFRYFPERLTEAYPEAVSGHRLRREVIATVLANAMINRGGPAFVSELAAATSADTGQIAAAYAAARDAFGLAEYNAELDRLDGKVEGEVQLGLYLEVQALLRGQTLWFLRNSHLDGGLAPLIERYQRGIKEVRQLLGGLASPYLSERIARSHAGARGQGAARPTRPGASRSCRCWGSATDIVLVAERTGATVSEAATAFLGVLDTFELGRVMEKSQAIVLPDRFDRMALDRALANLTRAQRDLTADVIAIGGGDVPGRLSVWLKSRPEAIARVSEAVRGLTEGEMTVSRLSVAAGLLGDLARGG